MAKKGRRATNEERFAAIQMYDNGLTADRIAEILNVGRVLGLRLDREVS